MLLRFTKHSLVALTELATAAPSFANTANSAITPYSPSANRNWRDSLHAARNPPETGPAPINCTIPSNHVIALGGAPLGHSSLSGLTTPFASG